MQVVNVPGFNPWASVGEKLGQGLSQGMEQGLNRGMVHSALNNVAGIIDNPNTTPGTLYTQLAKAFAGFPGGSQLLSETFPIMLQEMRRRAYPGATGQQGQPGEIVNQLSGGQNGFAPSYSPMQRLSQGYASQQAPGMYPQGQQPGMQQPQMQQPSLNQWPLQQENVQEPQARNVPANFQQRISPQAYTDTPGKIERDAISFVEKGFASPKEGLELAKDLQSLKMNAQQAVLDREIAEMNAQKWAEERNQISNKFVDERLEKDGITDPYLQRKVYDDYYRMRGEYPEKSDAERWSLIKNRVNELKNASSAMLSSGSGRPTVESFFEMKALDSARDRAKKANESFLSAMGSDPSERKYSVDDLQEAARLNMSNGWEREEAYEMAVPYSKGVLKSVSGAEDALNPRTDENYWTVNELLKKSPEEMQDAYDSLAAKLAKEMDAWDNILPLRNRLKVEKNWDEQDFNNLLSSMAKMGWEPSPWQQVQMMELQGKIEPDAFDLLSGASWRRAFLRMKPQLEKAQ